MTVKPSLNQKTSSTARLSRDEFGRPISLPKPKNKKVESNLQKQIADLLVKRGWLVVRLNSGAIKTAHGFFFAYTIVNDNSHAGMPDLWCMKNGVCLLIEVKKPKSTATIKQVMMHKRISNAGFTVHVVSSLDHVVDLVRFYE